MANVALAPVESSSNTVNRVPPVYSRPDKAVFFRLARKELMPPKHAAIAAIIACNEQSFKRAELMEKTLRDTGLMFEHIRRGYPVNREEYMKWLDDDEIDYLFGYWNDLQRQGRAPIFDKEIHDSEFEYLRVALLRALGGQFRDQSSGKTVSSDLATTCKFSISWR